MWEENPQRTLFQGEPIQSDRGTEKFNPQHVSYKKSAEHHQINRYLDKKIAKIRPIPEGFEKLTSYYLPLVACISMAVL